MEQPAKKLTARKVVLLAILFIAAVLTAITFIHQSPEPEANSSRMNVTALALGVTNDARGRAFAIFQLTNGTRTEVGVFVEAIDQFGSNEWTRTELKGPIRSWINEWLGERKNILPPGATYTFAAPQPVTNDAWRIVFRCVERQSLRDRPRELMIGFTNSSARNDRVFSGRNYHVITPGVSP